jgi:hypothetical protein
MTMPTIYQAPRRKSHPPAPLLSTVHDALLDALSRYVYLTSDLACRLLYKPGSLTYVRSAFKTLDDAGLVCCLYLGRQTPGGSSKKVFTLSARGLAYLRRAGVPTWPRYHAQEQVEVGTLHLRHHLGVASTLVAAELLCRQTPELSLERLMIEKMLRREFRAKVTVPNGRGPAKPTSVWPDAYLEFRAGRRLMPVALEYDRGTETRPAWQAKVVALLAYADGPFQGVSGRQSLTIAVLTPHSEKRRRDLESWTADVITAKGGVDAQTDLFRFAFAHPDHILPDVLFLSTLWHAPTRSPATALLAPIMERLS